MYKNIAETMGLTDVQKKQLFYPGTKFGRKLKPDEQQPVLEAEVRPVVVVAGMDGIGDSILSTPFLTSGSTLDKNSSIK